MLFIYYGILLFVLGAIVGLYVKQKSFMKDTKTCLTTFKGRAYYIRDIGPSINMIGNSTYYKSTCDKINEKLEESEDEFE